MGVAKKKKPGTENVLVDTRLKLFFFFYTREALLSHQNTELDSSFKWNRLG